jgi:hypothetical protein
MPDELPHLLDAWGRREASAATPALPPVGPSARFLAAARQARTHRLVLRVAAFIAAGTLLVVIVMTLKSGAHTAPPASHSATKSVEP